MQVSASRVPTVRVGVNYSLLREGGGGGGGGENDENAESLQNSKKNKENFSQSLSKIFFNSPKNTTTATQV